MTGEALPIVAVHSLHRTDRCLRVVSGNQAEVNWKLIIPSPGGFALLAFAAFGSAADRRRRQSA